MEHFVLKGQLCFSTDMDTLQTLPDGFLVCEDGKSKGVFRTLPEKYQSWRLLDFGDRLILPGMTDLHIHAPQFAFRGLGMDMELLDWLNTHTFPEEAKYQDLEYADRAYDQFTAHIRRSPTTRLCIFGTLHVPATELLMDKLEASGLISYVGKVNMDRNCPEYLREPSVEEAVRQTGRWLAETAERYENTKPILTPRFIPSCSDALMKSLRKLQEEYHVPVQSHLSENYGEIDWVQSLCPSSRFYGDAYEQFHLFGGDHRCIMAHCTHSTDAEMELMKKNGVFIAHSPESNMNLASGVAPVNRYLENGLNVALATDMAGGSHESMFRVITHAIQASKLRWRLFDQSVKPLTFRRAFYLATVGGGSFFGKVGSFAEGYALDALVLDDSNLEHPQPLSVEERLERAAYLSDERNLHAKFVAGKRLF